MLNDLFAVSAVRAEYGDLYPGPGSCTEQSSPALSSLT